MSAGQIWLAIIAILGLLAWFIPRLGLRARVDRWRLVRHRIRVEDTLKHMLAVEQRGVAATGESVAGAIGLKPASTVGLLEQMERMDLLESRGGALSLTESGRDYALQIVRAHRLLERWLDDETDIPLTDLHRAADRAEHRLSADEADALDARLGHPVTDPHGDPIPTASGKIAPFPGVPLTDYPVGVEAEVTHLEDEPPGVFQTIVRQGLSRGTRVLILERGPGVVHMRVNGRDLRLPSVAAANVHVGPPRAPVPQPANVIALSELPRHEIGQVVGIDDDVRGLTRRRLLDLGVTPGVRIEPELEPLFGRPRAFRIRETLVALRDEQAAGIRVLPVDPESEQGGPDSGGS